jgi:hypothetical protein
VRAGARDLLHAAEAAELDGVAALEVLALAEDAAHDGRARDGRRRRDDAARRRRLLERRRGRLGRGLRLGVLQVPAHEQHHDDRRQRQVADHVAGKHPGRPRPSNA